MNINKEKILVYLIITPLLFAASTLFGVIGSIIMNGKLFLCSLDIGIIEYFFSCDFITENMETTKWFSILLMFLGKLFFWVTLPVTIIGFIVFNIIVVLSPKK